jgi:polar amino acid transport system substrate-binding protein
MGRRRLVLAVAGCGGEDTAQDAPPAAAQAADPATDKLAQIRERGTLILSTDPAYPPQSFRVKGAARPSGTKDYAAKAAQFDLSAIEQNVR